MNSTVSAYLQPWQYKFRSRLKVNDVGGAYRLRVKILSEEDIGQFLTE